MIYVLWVCVLFDEDVCEWCCMVDMCFDVDVIECYMVFDMVDWLCVCM